MLGWAPGPAAPPAPASAAATEPSRKLARTAIHHAPVLLDRDHPAKQKRAWRGGGVCERAPHDGQRARASCFHPEPGARTPSADCVRACGHEDRDDPVWLGYETDATDVESGARRAAPYRSGRHADSWTSSRASRVHLAMQLVGLSVATQRQVWQMATGKPPVPDPSQSPLAAWN